MTNHSSPLLTNTLLVIIAVLLLVLVIQNGMQSPANYRRPVISSSGPYSEAHAGMPMPEAQGETREAAPAPNMANEMVFHAVKAFPVGCEGKQVIAECESPAAQGVKKKISEFASGKGPRQIFDFIVATWGEKVLTDQALQIRQMRTQKKP